MLVGKSAIASCGFTALVSFPKSHNLKGDKDGWGTALKPAWEPIILARKPLEGTVAANVQKWGTGAINVGGCRVGTESHVVHGKESGKFQPTGGATIKDYHSVQGRWPANLIHDGSEEVLELFPETGNGSGRPTIKKRQRNKGWCNSSPGEGVDAIDNFGDSGSAARFFKKCEFSEEELCEFANTADGSSCLSRSQGDSVLSGVLTSDNQEENAIPMGQYTVIRDSIGNSKECSQPQNPVLFAEAQEPIVITRITENRSKLSGSVPHAIGAKIKSVANAEKGSISLDGRRLIYTPKASRAERNAGCSGLDYEWYPGKEPTVNRSGNTQTYQGPDGDVRRGTIHPNKGNVHPCVKPLALMRYLCRLVTPPNGIILDPFMGSGTTGMAAKQEGFGFFGIEKEKEYIEIAERRIDAA
jgi:hypothetical protein